MNARFSLGIDLGTSNSAIAVADLETDQTRIVDITQILGPNELGELPTLASALYVPHSQEFPEGSFPLPWNDIGDPAIVGQFARDHGALVPDRLVTSAKSWLSNPHIDQKQRILPWRYDIAENKLCDAIAQDEFNGRAGKFEIHRHRHASRAHDGVVACEKLRAIGREDCDAIAASQSARKQGPRNRADHLVKLRVAHLARLVCAKIDDRNLVLERIARHDQALPGAGSKAGILRPSSSIQVRRTGMSQVMLSAGQFTIRLR